MSDNKAMEFENSVGNQTMTPAAADPVDLKNSNTSVRPKEGMSIF